MTIINAVKFKLAAGMGKIELLTDCIMLVHIPGYLDPHVKLVPIQGAGDGVAKMFELVHPGEVSSTKLPWCLKKCHEICLTFVRVLVSRKSQIMACCIFLTSVQHVLQGI